MRQKLRGAALVVALAAWREAFMSDAQSADAYVVFALKPDATVERMTMSPVSPAIDFSFDFQDLLFTPLPAEQRPQAPSRYSQ